MPNPSREKTEKPKRRKLIQSDVHIPCMNGQFTLPDELLQVLQTASPSGIIYLRQDEDALTLSPARMVDSKRRQLRPKYRIEMFRTATKLAIVDLAEFFKIMPVEWRPLRGSEKRRESPPSD